MSSSTQDHSPTPPNTPPNPASPTTVILRATASEVVGASLVVAGLTVLERSLKQLERMGMTIFIASDGSCPLPKYLPPQATVRRVPRPEDMAALRKEQPDAVEIGANEVRPSMRGLEGGRVVTDEESRSAAETAIFAELMRGDLGFVARHLNKPVSFFLTRYLFCRLPFSPNQVTLGAAVIGLLGAAFIASGHYSWMIWGFFLAHFQSILDGCDGELARVRFQQSAIGEWLDTMVDDGLNIALFAAIGIGLYRAGQGTLPLYLGFIATGMHIVWDVVALIEMRRQGRGGEIIRLQWRLIGDDNMKRRLSQKQGKSPLDMVYTLGRRDFFVLAFLVYALLNFAIPGIARLTLIHALLITTPLLVVAVTQVIWRLRGSPE